MRISDWSSDVCSSDLPRIGISEDVSQPMNQIAYDRKVLTIDGVPLTEIAAEVGTPVYCYSSAILAAGYRAYADAFAAAGLKRATVCRSEEHTTELQSLMRSSYAVLRLKKKIRLHKNRNN